MSVAELCVLSSTLGHTRVGGPVGKVPCLIRYVRGHRGAFGHRTFPQGLPLGPRNGLQGFSKLGVLLHETCPFGPPVVDLAVLDIVLATLLCWVARTVCAARW